MTTTDVGRGGASPTSTLRETMVERACRGLCEATLVAMVVLISAEVVARTMSFSFEIVDEIGGYLLSALTFLSLPVALIGGAYHQVEYIQLRLNRRGRTISGIVFTLLSLVFALALLWQLWRLVYRSLVSNVTAPTLLGTPLWFPQSAMLIGVAALVYSLVRLLLVHGRELRRRASDRDGSHG
jgi:TRAP-type C4-dicarboxylate transport system permease small subunit